MKSRIVLLGHAAYYPDDGKCIIPKNTTITFYASPGSLLAKSITDALVNGEVITTKDLQAITNPLYFFQHDLPEPKKDLLKSSLNKYPKTFYPGDEVPNFFLTHFDAQKPTSKPINYTPTEVCTVSETMMLDQLLKDYVGNDLHWAACSFAKKPDEEAFGYGLVYKLKPETELKKQYSPVLDEKAKAEKRAKRFGIPLVSPAKEVKVANNAELFSRRSRPTNAAKDVEPRSFPTTSSSFKRS